MALAYINVGLAGELAAAALRAAAAGYPDLAEVSRALADEYDRSQ